SLVRSERGAEPGLFMRISKLPKQMNNPDEAPLYPNSPDYTNSETALMQPTASQGLKTERPPH
ncbi:MAG TPA: hypothetical protein VII95_14975, partial [Terriglobales bacterium]